MCVGAGAVRGILVCVDAGAVRVGDRRKISGGLVEEIDGINSKFDYKYVVQNPVGKLKYTNTLCACLCT